jgi:type IV pilus assembly protein PilF
VKKWMALLLVAWLAGCAVQPTGGGSTTAGTPADNAMRNRARIFTELADAYYNRAQYKVALDELRKAITIDNRFGPAYNVYGLIYMELGEDKLAEENFRHAIELDGNDSETRNNFGWYLCTRGRYDEGLSQLYTAFRNLMKSLKLQPDNPNTLLKLAGFNFRQGHLAEAQRLLGRRADLALPTAESLWLNVRLERKLGDRAQEASYGLQLRKKFPDSNESRLLMDGQFE